MELEIGMYVRYQAYTTSDKTLRTNKIGKIIWAKSSVDCYELDTHRKISQLGVIKSSYDVIDLVELGDYVNGELIVGIQMDEVTNEKRLLTTNNRIITNGDIKAILTREQMKDVSYKVFGYDW